MADLYWSVALLLLVTHSAYTQGKDRYYLISIQGSGAIIRVIVSVHVQEPHHVNFHSTTLEVSVWRHVLNYTLETTLVDSVHHVSDSMHVG